MTKIFCDIADIKLIRKFNKKKIVKGFTTNPSLMRKAGAKDYSKYSKKIIKITKKPVSCEVFADDIKNMILQGNEISKFFLGYKDFNENISFIFIVIGKYSDRFDQQVCSRMDSPCFSTDQVFHPLTE